MLNAGVGRTAGKGISFRLSPEAWNGAEGACMVASLCYAQVGSVLGGQSMAIPFATKGHRRLSDLTNNGQQPINILCPQNSHSNGLRQHQSTAENTLVRHQIKRCSDKLHCVRSSYYYSRLQYLHSRSTGLLRSWGAHPQHVAEAGWQPRIVLEPKNQICLGQLFCRT